MQSVQPPSRFSSKPAAQRWLRGPHAPSAARRGRRVAPPIDVWVARVFALALALCVGLGCAAGSGGKGKAAGGTVTMFTKSATLRIVSDAWVASQGYEGADAELRRAEFYRLNTYTQDGTSAAIKVCADDVFNGIVEALDGAGFNRFATDGSAPSSGGVSAIELVQTGRARHLLGGEGRSLEHLKALRDSMAVIGTVFNALDGYQSGAGDFDFQRTPPRKR